MQTPFQSVPVVPAQPDQVTYSPADLELFTYPNPADPGGSATLTRALYLALNGVQAPVYDPTNPTRNWYDQSATPGYPSPGSYLVIETSGSTATLQTIPVPANVQFPNLPGAYQYPAWDNPQTTTAQITFPGFPAQPLSPTFLCSEADAQAVASALPAGTTVGEDSTDFMVTWNTETRRRYTVSVPDGPQQLYAAQLRAAMTQIQVDAYGNYVSGGAGSPGTFVVNGAIGSPAWVPTPDPGLSAGPAMAVPCRALISSGADQEVFVPGPLGFGVQVLRLDLLAASGAATAGGLSSNQGSWVLQALEAIGESLKLDLPAPPAN